MQIANREHYAEMACEGAGSVGFSIETYLAEMFFFNPRMQFGVDSCIVVLKIGRIIDG